MSDRAVTGRAVLEMNRAVIGLISYTTKKDTYPITMYLTKPGFDFSGPFAPPPIGNLILNGSETRLSLLLPLFVLIPR